MLMSRYETSNHLTPPRVANGRVADSATGDRFIASRSATDFDYAHHLLTETQRKTGDGESSCSPSKLAYRKIMAENLTGRSGDGNTRILHYTGKAPANSHGFQSHVRAVYTRAHSPMAKKTNRVIPHVPERVLDAPEVVDDFYLNILDWGVSNHLAVALGGAVYVWNASTGSTSQLPIPESEYSDTVASLAWDQNGQYLAVGKGNKHVELWNVEKMKRLRVMKSQNARVQCLAWNSHVLASGSSSGSIHQHDVRIPDHHIATLNGHSQGVCALKWSPNGKYLASGGNDNVVQIWKYDSTRQQEPHLTINQHLAAVKGLSWCPWQPSLLATGGGTADRHIRLININSGQCIKEVDTKSQISGLLWSDAHRELISSHGNPRNQLTIWKYPSLNRVCELEGHTGRTLAMSMSPDGDRVVSMGADETIRIWNCFEGAAVAAKKKAKKSIADTFALKRDDGDDAGVVTQLLVELLEMVQKK